jgi:hypothetical protein
MIPSKEALSLFEGAKVQLILNPPKELSIILQRNSRLL